MTKQADEIERAVDALLWPYKVIDIDRTLTRRTNLEARQSEDMKYFFRVRERGLPFVLTGYAVTLRIYPVIGHATLIGSTTATIDDAAKGHMTVALARATLATFLPGRWEYTLVGVSGGNSREFCRGDFVLRPGTWA